MDTTTGKRTARVKLTLTKRTVENLQPADKPWIAWDARLSGFGVRVQPSGTKVFLVNYRTRSGGRRARNRRVGIGRCDHLAPEEARRLAQELLGRVARGEDPAQERADRRGMPTLREAFAEYLTANPNRKRSTEALYRSQMRYCLGDWLARPLDTITRRDVEARFHLVSQRNGWAVANHIIALLRSVYRRPCVDHESLRNPVDLWLAGGGRYHRPVHRRISTPAETLPRWWAAIEAEVVVATHSNVYRPRDGQPIDPDAATVVNWVVDDGPCVEVVKATRVETATRSATAAQASKTAANPDGRADNYERIRYPAEAHSTDGLTARSDNRSPIIGADFVACSEDDEGDDDPEGTNTTCDTEWSYDATILFASGTFGKTTTRDVTITCQWDADGGLSVGRNAAPNHFIAGGDDSNSKNFIQCEAN